MSTHNIWFYKEVDKKYTSCNLKTTELLDRAFIGVCAVIRSNTVGCLRKKMLQYKKKKSMTGYMDSFHLSV